MCIVFALWHAIATFQSILVLFVSIGGAYCCRRVSVCDMSVLLALFLGV